MPVLRRKRSVSDCCFSWPTTTSKSPSLKHVGESGIGQHGEVTSRHNPHRQPNIQHPPHPSRSANAGTKDPAPRSRPLKGFNADDRTVNLDTDVFCGQPSHQRQHACPPRAHTLTCTTRISYQHCWRAISQWVRQHEVLEHAHMLGAAIHDIQHAVVVEVDHI